MRRDLVIVAIILLCWADLSAHPVHVSVANLEFTDKESVVAVKLFKDDLQLAIYHNYSIEIPLDSIGNENYSKIILTYLMEKLKIVVNKKKELKLEYTGNEYNEEAIWVYFSAGNLQEMKNIYLINTIFLDIYEDQTNLVIINYKGKQQGHRFNILFTEKEINLNG